MLRWWCHFSSTHPFISSSSFFSHIKHLCVRRIRRFLRWYYHVRSTVVQVLLTPTYIGRCILYECLSVMHASSVSLTPDTTHAIVTTNIIKFYEMFGLNRELRITDVPNSDRRELAANYMSSTVSVTTERLCRNDEVHVQHCNKPSFMHSRSPTVKGNTMYAHVSVFEMPTKARLIF